MKAILDIPNASNPWMQPIVATQVLPPLRQVALSEAKLENGTRLTFQLDGLTVHLPLGPLGALSATAERDRLRLEIPAAICAAALGAGMSFNGLQHRKHAQGATVWIPPGTSIGIPVPQVGELTLHV